MAREELEFAISQYLDGSLPPLERAALEKRLVEDVEARRLLEDERKLNALLSSLPAVPAVKWEALHRHLSGAVAKEEAPIRNYSITSAFARNLRRVALAACVALAAGVGVWVYRSRVSPPVEPSGYAQVQGPQVEQAAGPALAEIQIGPSPLALGSEDQLYSESVLSRPSQVIIASGNSSAQDSDPLYR